MDHPSQEGVAQHTHRDFKAWLLQFVSYSIEYFEYLFSLSMKMIPDLKQQVSELQKQKMDLENRLQEEAIKNEGNWEPVSANHKIQG